MALHTDKHVDFKDAATRSASLKEKGNSIVFTNGCFDVLHAGHIYYLLKAKQHGELLWMGLNSDRSVQSLKGPTRPIHSQDARAYVLSALECIDLITIFDENTPLALIEQIKPDIHVKGGDYDKKSLPEYPIVTSYGGEVIIESFLPGFSTSSILKKGEL
ncbi:D-glycero-beta-D-manno-heptose 1-phosphate adenylyltransferase [Candidatus Marinamargulisbacteria bacterium SCGC AG-343-D04]|nr:D-glycero-beta-D-manno-heptose 1-phosphate adenylyltransferase [Candidatus Marinamargulisbacteria bacterium SCGC AG-343-D04]